MALSPAEKQRRYRVRLRERLEAARNAVHPDDLAIMRESWELSIEELRQQRNQAQRENMALREEIAQLRAELERAKSPPQ